MNQILERISKALKLGKDNNNEHEAQAKILAAQRLIAKYKKEDINDFLNENKKQDNKVIEENADNETNNDKWKRSLMNEEGKRNGKNLSDIDTSMKGII